MKKLLAIVTLSLATLVANAANVTLQGNSGTYTLPEELKMLAGYFGEGHAVFCTDSGTYTGVHGTGKLMDCTSRVPGPNEVLWSCLPDAGGEWESACTHNGQTDTVEYIMDVSYYILPAVATLKWDDGNIIAEIAPDKLTWAPIVNDAIDPADIPVVSYAAIKEREANLPYPTFNDIWCETDFSTCDYEGVEYAKHEIQAGKSPVTYFWRNRDGQRLPYDIPGGMYCEGGYCHDQFDNVIGVDF